MKRAIDLRSDTVTQPSAGMRKAMAEAVVGDDVLDRDPTTKRLEELVADLLGKDDALFFPTGTMANQTAIRLLAPPGSELIIEARAHLVDYEAGGIAANAGVQIRPVTTPDGLLTEPLVRAALRPNSPFVPRIGAVAIENTHNAAGGRVLSLAATDAIGALAREQGVPLHLDGARLWHAAHALDAKLARLARPATTVMVAFSKALGCPAGSVLALPEAARRDAWMIRKRMGGGLRQSGILAAAALYALEHNLERIGEDHAHAVRFAAALAGHPHLGPLAPDSNIVMLDLTRERDTAEAWAPKLADRGVLLAPYGPKRLRAVMHLDVTTADVDEAAAIIAETVR